MRFRLSKLFLVCVSVVALGAVLLMSTAFLAADIVFYRGQAASIREALTDSGQARVREICGNVMHVTGVIRAESMQEFRNNLEGDAFRSYEIADGLYAQSVGRLPEPELRDLVGTTLLAGAPRAEDVRFFWIDAAGQMNSRAPSDSLVLSSPAPLALLQGNFTEDAPAEMDFAPSPDSPSIRSLVYARHFAPLNWIIGVAASVQAAERNAQQKVIKAIESIEIGDSGYVFAGQWDGLVLAGPGKGRNLLTFTDSSGVEVIKELINAAKGGGGFVRYTLEPPEKKIEVPKISFVLPVNDWQWYIGTGMYVADIERGVESAHARMRGDMARNLGMTLGICGLVVLLAMAGSMLLAKHLGREAQLFATFFAGAADNHLVSLDIDRFHVEEFISIGEAANRMLLQRRRAEDELRESEERFSKAFWAGPDSIVITRFADGVFLEANNRFYQQTGYTEAEVIGHSSTELYWPDSGLRDVFLARLRETGEVNDFPIGFRHKDGMLQDYLLSARSIELHGELCIISISRDISAQKQAEQERMHLEQQLRQAQKMEAVGQLAGGVAHDFNNLLQAMSGYTSLSQSELPAEHPVQEYLVEVEKAAERAATLVRQLLAFGRRELLRPKRVDLNELVSGFLKMVGRVIGKSIDLQFKSAPDLASIFADPGQLEQVVLNLCINARDAMPNGGILAIETAQVDLDADYCREHSWAKEGSFVILRVVDTGTGMTPEVIEHVFEPFFSTKGVGKGSGLGLSMVYGIIKQHDGLIDIHSTPGAGSSFCLYLPVMQEQAAHVEILTKNEFPSGSETILLAEDDPMMRDFTSCVLEGAGYRVITACDGEEAMDLFRRYAVEIDLAVLDVVMPNRGGPAVFNRMQLERDDLPVLFCTGYGQIHIDPKLTALPGFGLMSKPFTQGDLLFRVRAMLDSSG